MAQGDNAASTLRSFVAPLLGMSMFWPFFRYASYFTLLYPQGRTVPSPLGPVSAHVCFLFMLLALAVVAFLAHSGVSALLRRRRLVVCSTIALGTVAALVAMLVDRAALPAAALWASVVLAAVSFLAGYLAWADYYSCRFDSLGLALLAASLLLSYILFSREGLLGSLAGGWLAALVIPAGTGLLWHASSQPQADLVEQAEPDRAERGLPAEAAPFSPAQLMHPLALVIAAFLLVGGAVRGVVDTHGAMTGTRFGLSLFLTVSIAVACLAYLRRRRQLTVTAFILLCWLALVTVFLLGLFVFLVLGRQLLGGDVVVVSRTVMEFAFWALLCRIAYTQRIEPVPLFLALGVSVETVSWLLSYAVVPSIDALTVGSASSSSFVLGVIFAITMLMSVAMLAFAIRTARSSRGVAPLLVESLSALELGGGLDVRALDAAEDGNRDDAGRPRLPDDAEHAPTGGDAGTPPPGDGPASPASPDRRHGAADRAAEGSNDRDLAEYLMRHERLTAREAQVAVLYARGYSLAKVADELVITKSTAQTHIKAAYRKLDVHSRDELIDRLGM